MRNLEAGGEGLPSWLGIRERNIPEPVNTSRNSRTSGASDVPNGRLSKYPSTPASVRAAAWPVALATCAIGRSSPAAILRRARESFGSRTSRPTTELTEQQGSQDAERTCSETRPDRTEQRS